MSADARWYLQRNGKAAGPFSLADLKNQVRQGALHGHDLIFQDGADEWKRAFDCPELATEIFSEQRTSFTGLFVLPPGEGEGWVVLIRRQEGKSMRFDQQGPLSTEKVLGLLKSGEVKSTDHVWKKGFDQWVGIYTLPEFSPSLWNLKDESRGLLASVVEAPQAEAKPAPAPLPEPLPVIEMPTRVAQVKPAEAKPVVEKAPEKPAEKLPEKPPEKPVEAKAAVPKPAPAAKPALPPAMPEPAKAQLPKAEVTLPDAPSEEFIQSMRMTPGALAQAQEKAQEKMARKRREAATPDPVEAPPPAKARNSVPFRMGGREWFIVSVLIVVIFGALPVLKKKYMNRDLVLQQAEPLQAGDVMEGTQDHASTAEIPAPEAPSETAPATEAPAMDLPPSEPVAAVAKHAAPAAKPEPRKAVKAEVPALIYKSPPKPSERKINWSFSPAADAGSSLLVLITGFSGQVLDVNAVNMKLHLFLPSNRRLLIEPRSLQLPEGEYLVQIYQGGRSLARSEQRFVLDEERFQKKIAQHRKQIVFEQQSEKRNLLRSLDGLQRFLSRNQGSLSGKTMTSKTRTSLQRSLEALQRPEVRKLRQNNHALMYPGGWNLFATQYESARSLLDKAGSRNPAGKPDLDALKKKIDQARTQVSRTSLWGN